MTRCWWKDEAMAYYEALSQGNLAQRGTKILLETHQNIHCHKWHYNVMIV